MSNFETYALKQRKVLSTEFTTAEVDDAKVYCNVTTSIEEMSDQEVVIVSNKLCDDAAEEYAAKMRVGHGIGCYCGYCCM